MSFRRLVGAVTFILVFAIGFRFAADTDTWWHLAAGRWTVMNGQPLLVDIFSFTRAGASWANPGWLSQLLLYGVYAAAGLNGLNWLTAGLAVLGFVLIWPTLTGRPLLRGFLMLLAASTAAIFWAARPHMLSFVLTAAFVRLLERARRGHAGALVGLPLLMLVWGNAHGGFAIGILLIGAYLAGSVVKAWRGAAAGSRASAVWQASRPLLLVGAASALAASVNPLGPRLLLLPLQTVSIDSLQQYIQEWQTPDFHQPQVLPYAIMLLLLWLSLAMSRRRKHPVELILAAGFTWMSLSAARNVAIFAIVVLPGLSRHLSAVLSQSPMAAPRRQLSLRMSRGFNLLLLALVILGSGVWVASKSSATAIEAEMQARLPVGAVGALNQAGLAGPLLNEYDWGGYLIWQSWPQLRTYVDGRTDLFGDVVLTEYLALWRAEPGWESIVLRRGFRTALLSSTAPIAIGLRSAGWVTVYEDSMSIVLSHPDQALDPSQ